MKNVNKRSKILLGTGALVLVVVVAGILLLEPSGFGLFGTTTYPYFSPRSLTLPLRATTTLTVVGNPSSPAPQCTFSSSNQYFAWVLSNTANTVKIFGQGPGNASIKATCNVGTTYASVKVYDPNAPIYLR